MDVKTIAAIIAGAGAAIWGANAIKNKVKYDENGYDKNGYDKDGYDKNGYDKDGYDRCGYDKDGYNRRGYDEDGYDKDGYDQHEYHYYDYDYYHSYGYVNYWVGLNKEGYNRQGLDEAKHNKQFYSEEINKLRKKLDVSEAQIKSKDYSRVVYDVKFVFEEALSLMIQHQNGYGAGSKSLDNLKRCSKLDKEMLDKLYSVRRICEKNVHKFENNEKIDDGTIRFAIEQNRELLKRVENYCGLINGK